ncbi:carboxymuconolactone decarboxylase family protein [Psychroserpens damuponensis]|uniref:carboxymuconolactone decarboxylase family protein n=1 Tax=Psychroserpens damuponensis TaxID=943936 RepID=UPI00058E32B5|nr:carboxymuconolactone decarboxylase family protein [Psychroserpens damuponensis]
MNTNSKIKFEVPIREQMSKTNAPVYDAIVKSVGFMPNLFATLGLSDNGLNRYISFQNAISSLTNKEKEVINLIVSEVNDCNYCRAAHTVIGKMNGFTDSEAIEIRSGQASFDRKLNALIKLSQDIVNTRGKINQKYLELFFNEGYNQGHLIDVILQIGEKTITNYLHNITQIKIDFPEVPKI